MPFDVGADVESMCNKCGDVWHVVVAKVEDTIAKVQCKECGGTHRYRPPGAKRATVARRGSKPSKKKAKKAAEPEPPEPVVQPDTSKPIRAYRIDATYELGERIEHPHFGTGVVENTSTPGKIGVFFPDRRRLLAAAKPEPALEPGGRAGLGVDAEDQAGGR